MTSRRSRQADKREREAWQRNKPPVDPAHIKGSTKQKPVQLQSQSVSKTRTPKTTRVAR